MIRHALDSLIKLRRLREDRALEEIAAHEQEKLRTQHELAEAIEVLTEYERLSVERERTKLATLMGQRLAPSELTNLQSALNASDDHCTKLQEKRQWTQKSLKAKSEEAQKARALFLLKHRQSEKLQALADMMAAGEKRRRLAVTETEDEEAYNRRTGLPSDLSPSWGALRKR